MGVALDASLFVTGIAVGALGLFLPAGPGELAPIARAIRGDLAIAALACTVGASAAIVGHQTAPVRQAGTALLGIAIVSLVLAVGRSTPLVETSG